MEIGQGEATARRIAADRWEVAWQKSSHRRLKRPGWPNYSLAFHDNEEVGPALLPQIAKKTRLQPEDL